VNEEPRVALLDGRPLLGRQLDAHDSCLQIAG
jgi:hypothetical protein